MRKINKVISSILILLIFCLSSCGYKTFLSSKTLLTREGKKTSILKNIQYNKETSPFVLIFLASECPISQKYAPILRGVLAQFPQVKFLAIFTKWDKTPNIEEYLKDYPLSNFNDNVNNSNNFIVLKDEKNNLIKKIDAQITPEAFLFDKNGVLMYRGAIDNWFFALGKYRAEATEHYLVDALQSFLKNKPVKIKKTNAIGCIIEK
jgi:thiol-disulfide isomerase/thioredoxin